MPMFAPPPGPAEQDCSDRAPDAREPWPIDDTRDVHEWLDYHRGLCAQVRQAAEILQARTPIGVGGLRTAVAGLERALRALQDAEPEVWLQRHWNLEESSRKLDRAWGSFFSVRNRLMMVLSSVYRIVRIAHFTTQNLRFLWEQAHNAPPGQQCRVEEVLQARDRLLEIIRQYRSALAIHNHS